MNAEHDATIAWRESSAPAQRVPARNIHVSRDGKATVVTMLAVCPACRGGTVCQLRTVSPGGKRVAGDDPAADATPTFPPGVRAVTVRCACRFPHPGRPPGDDEGCGRTWPATWS